MKELLLLTGIGMLLCGCNPGPTVLQETGIIVMDDARNCQSLDYFIPCSINDTITLGQNIRKVNKHIARFINPGQFQFTLLTTGWPSSADSFYVRSNHGRRSYLSAVQLILKREDDLSVNDIRKIDPMPLAGNISITHVYPGQYRIVRVRKIILPE